jgi:ComF family protein
MALFNDFMSLIYPRLCEGCGHTLFSHERYLCRFCLASLPRSNYHALPDNEIARLLRGRVPAVIASAFLLYEKSGRVQSMLHAIKYHDQKELGEFLGMQYAAELRDAPAVEQIDVILPVPLHESKLRARGYNQSEWFARGLAAGLNKSVDCTSLRRSRATSTQTRKRKYERWENVEGIFELGDRPALEGRHCLLVDDVITTGATIEAAWLAIRQAAGASISVMSIAFAAKAA